MVGIYLHHYSYYQMQTVSTGVDGWTYFIQTHECLEALLWHVVDDVHSRVQCEEAEGVVEADARDVHIQRTVEAFRELVGGVPQNGYHAFICESVKEAHEHTDTRWSTHCYSRSKWVWTGVSECGLE